MADNTARAQQALKFYTEEKGYSLIQAAGIVGHLLAESGLNPTTVHDNGTGIGIAGWRDPTPGQGRKTDLRNFASARGWDPLDFRTQLEFVDYELKNSPHGRLAWQKLQTAKSVDEATTAFMHFERPAGYTPDNPTAGHNYSGRLQNAYRVAGLDPSTAPAVPTRASWAVRPTDSIAAASGPITSYQDTLDLEIRRLNGESPGFWSTTVEATARQWDMRNAWGLRDRFVEADPNFQVTQQMLDGARTRGISEDELPRLVKTWNQAHFDRTIDNILTDRKLQEKLATMAPWKATTSALVSGILSPETAIGVASGAGAEVALGRVLSGALRPSMAASRSAYVARQATLGAAGNAAGDAVISWAKDEKFTADDAFHSALLGAAFGVGFGYFGQARHFAKEAEALNAATQDAADDLVRAAAREQRAIGYTPEPPPGAAPEEAALEPIQARAARPRVFTPEQIAEADDLSDPAARVETIDSRKSSAGARQAGSSEALHPEIAEANFIRDGDVPVGAFTALDPRLKSLPQWAQRVVRFSAIGQLTGHFDPMTRLVASHLFPDSVGWVGGGVIEKSAWDLKDISRRTWSETFRRDYYDAFDAWSKENGLTHWDRAFGGKKAEFNRAVSEAIREEDPVKRGQMDPHVLKAADNVARLLNEIRKDLQNPLRHRGGIGQSVKGFETLDENPHYLPRLPDFAAIELKNQRYGEANMAALFSAAFRKKVPGVEQEYADRIGRAYNKAARIRAFDGSETGKLFDPSGDLDGIRKSLESLMEDLKAAKAKNPAMDIDDALLSAEDIESLVQKLQRQEDNVANSSRAKHRLSLDETFEADIVPLHGGPAERVRLFDLFENDVEKLVSHYVNWASGWHALAQTKIINPTTGEAVTEGITSPAEIDRIKNLLKKTATNTAAEKGLNPDDVAKVQAATDKNLAYLFNALSGVPLHQWGSAAQPWLQRLSGAAYLTSMGLAGFASLFEAATALSSVTYKAMRSNVPTLDEYIRKIKTGEWTNELGRELELFAGIGADPHIGRHSSLMGEADLRANAMGQSASPADRFGETLDTAIYYGKRVMNYANGLKPITEWSQQAVGRAVAQHIADHAMGRATKVFDDQMWADLGLSVEQRDRILETIRKKASFEPGPMTGEKLAKLNLENWTDNAQMMEDRFDLLNAIRRFTYRTIQENDIGAMHRWMTAPGVNLLMQFKTWSANAWEKQLLYNLNAYTQGGEAQQRAVSYFLIGSMAGVIGYIARTAVVGLAQPDKEAYYEKRLSPGNIAASIVSRSSWGSFLPEIADTALGLGGMQLFDQRTTASTNMFSLDGIPALRMVNGLYNVPKVLLDEAFGDGATAAQKKRAAAVIPFSNTLGGIYAIGRTIDDTNPAALDLGVLKGPEKRMKREQEQIAKDQKVLKPSDLIPQKGN